MTPRPLALVLPAVLALAACGSAERPSAPAQAAPAPRLVVDDDGGTPKRGPGDLYNACERIWCVAHEKNFDLDHFLTGHVGWIVHDEASGDVFVPRARTSGPAFPHARANVLRLCGKHLHPYWLGKGGPITKSGYNLALGYDRAHFGTYGTRVPPCCLNAQGWGFLHASTPREFRFGDRASVEEMAGAGWQKAFRASR